jgi:hypothetical protein
MRLRSLVFLRRNVVTTTERDLRPGAGERRPAEPGVSTRFRCAARRRSSDSALRLVRPGPLDGSRLRDRMGDCVCETTSAGRIRCPRYRGRPSRVAARAPDLRRTASPGRERLFRPGQRDTSGSGEGVSTRAEGHIRIGRRCFDQGRGTHPDREKVFRPGQRDISGPGEGRLSEQNHISGAGGGVSTREEGDRRFCGRSPDAAEGDRRLARGAPGVAGWGGQRARRGIGRGWRVRPGRHCAPAGAGSGTPRALVPLSYTATAITSRCRGTENSCDGGSQKTSDPETFRHANAFFACIAAASALETSARKMELGPPRSW